MQDFDVERCKAIVATVSDTEDGRTDILLYQTCFYARGGGQDWDTGTITAGGAVFSVEEVRLDEHGVVHHIGTSDNVEILAEDSVTCSVDSERRSVNTRLHSAGHVIDMAVDALGLDWVSGKGQHYPHLSAVEYTGSWDPEQAEELRQKIEHRASELVLAGSQNRIEFMPVEEMKKVCRNVPENIPTNKPGRVVMYGENFGIPCGGTHLKDIHEIGEVKIPKLKQKKGIIRLSYTVEGIN